MACKADSSWGQNLCSKLPEIARGRFGQKGKSFQVWAGKCFLHDSTWAKWQLQLTRNGYELIQVDDCDADEVPGGALVDVA